jgi:site-specific DNA-cytosine methylase
VRVLIACEFSGVVREAFRRRGHNAWSCDLLPAEDESRHHFECDVGGVLDLVGSGYRSQHGEIVPTDWDLMIAHPPCTHLAVSGARHFHRKAEQQEQALQFVKKLAEAPIPRICIENPVSVISTRLGPPTQIIQPWQFGHGETKATCLWLHWLPPLRPTNVVEGREARIHNMPPGPNRGHERSRTMLGIAEAMADQWGGLT